MINPQELATLQQTLSTAKSVLILLGQNPSYDAVAAAASLFLSMKRAGKATMIASPADMRVEFSHIIGVDQIKKEIGNRNLVVSFPYQEGTVDKVSYTISEDSTRFNLVIAPKTGATPLDPSAIAYSYTGSEAEVVFLIGVSRFEELGSIYESEKQMFLNALTVSVHMQQIQTYAKVTITGHGKSCLAEEVAIMLREFGMEAKEDAATNLLSAIEQATDRYQSMNMSPDTFEVVAQLMRNGAQRMAQSQVQPMTAQQTSAFAQALKVQPSVLQQSQQSAQVMQSPSVTQPVQQTMSSPMNVPQARQAVRRVSPQQKIQQLQRTIRTMSAQQPVQQTNAPTSQAAPVVSQNTTQPVAQTPAQPMTAVQQAIQSAGQHAMQPASTPMAQQEELTTNQAPQEWLQPKIFTGSSNV